jgi:Outer membrane protein beta-barrel domain
MRKQVTVLLMTGAMMTTGSARADTSFGVEGGFVAASLDVSGPSAFDTSADAGAAIGAFARLGLRGSVGFQPEILLTWGRFSASGVPTPFGVAFRSVEVPLLFHVRFPPKHGVEAFVCAGPQLSAISKVTQALSDGESDISDQIKNWDIGATFGGGVEASVGRGALVLEGRVNLGARNLDETSVGSFKARAFLALIGYRF